MEKYKKNIDIEKNDVRIAIVGFSLAGISALYTLIKHSKNINITVFDYDSKKPCAGIFTLKSLYLALEIFDIKFKEFLKFCEFVSDKYDVYYENKLIFSGKAAAFSFAVNREKFERYVKKRIKNVKIINEKVIKIDEKKNILYTKKSKYYYDFLIDASGVNSIILKKLEKISPNYNVGKKYFSLQTYGKSLYNENAFFYKKNLKGYFWSFPSKKGDILGGGSLINYRKLNKDFFSFLKNNSFYYLKNIKGAFIPATFVKKITFKNIVLTGDAAGFVDYIYGEGIYYAMFSGKAAALAVLKAIKEKKLSYFYEKYMKNIILNLKVARFYGFLFHNIILKREIFFKVFLIIFNKIVSETLHGTRKYFFFSKNKKMVKFNKKIKRLGEIYGFQRILRFKNKTGTRMHGTGSGSVYGGMGF